MSTSTTIITPEQRLHQQLMGRSNSHLNLEDPSHQSPLINHSHSTITTTIINPLGQTYSSPYHSANALISSADNLSLHSNSNQPPSRHHSINPSPSPTPSQSNLNQFIAPFDPDHEAELVRRRKLEARRSMYSSSQSLQPTTSRASFSVAPRSRRQSNASSIASNATSPLSQQRTRSPQPHSRRLLGSGSPSAQVHRPSPLRSASTPTLNLSETQHDEAPPPVPTLSQKSKQKLLKAEQQKIKKALIESERIRLNLPERRRSIWFKNTNTGSSNSTEKENNSKTSPKKNTIDEKDPFRKSMLQIEGHPDLMPNPSSPHKPNEDVTVGANEAKHNKKKTASTLSRLFGTLLSTTHNHSKSITVVDPRSPILSNPNPSKRLTVIETIKRTTMSKRRGAVPAFDPSDVQEDPSVFVPSKQPSESLEEESSGESLPRIGNVKSGNGVMVLVVDSH